MQGEESAARGFVLTGQQSYLDSFYTNVARLDQEQAGVRDLTRDNPIQQRQIPNLERLGARKIELAETVIALRQTKGLAGGFEFVQDHNGPAGDD